MATVDIVEAQPAVVVCDACGRAFSPDEEPRRDRGARYHEACCRAWASFETMPRSSHRPRR